MKVLIGCEFSGVVRQAFAERGHDVWSCDLLPSEQPGKHLQCDILSVIYGQKWDMLLAFPPCTYLCSSGLHWNKVRPEREKLTEQALDFVQKLLNAPIHKIALENPIGRISTAIRKPDQIIQPWMFGHGETKATCLWLKNLPLLKPTNIVNGRENRVWKMPPSKDRWRKRSTTYFGVGQAMSEQWG